jgi:thioredoxin family protein
MVSPAPGQFARDLAGQVKLVKANVDTAPQIPQRFGAQAIPALLVPRGGQVTARQTGATHWPPCGPGSTMRSPRPLAKYRHSPAALPGHRTRPVLAARGWLVPAG